MKKIMIYFAFVAAISGCTEEIKMFDNNYYLSIDLGKTEDKEFSEYSYTFKYQDPDLKETEIAIPVIYAGRLQTEDKTFTVKVVDSLTTAVEGIHYQLLNDKNSIAANQYQGKLNVKLMKTEEMIQKSYTLGLVIENDDNFKYGDNRLVVITFSDKIEKPEWWYTLSTGHIGYYTERKLVLWYEYWGITDGSNPWGGPPYYTFRGGRWLPDKAACLTSKEMFKAWLNKREDAPVRDENNDLIIFTLDRLIK